MSSFRCSVKPNLSRGKGQSLANTAAYQSRDKVRDERTGETFDYTRHPDKALWTGVYAPANAPDWARERESLCNAIEAAENRKDSQLARPIELNFPHELTLEENRRLLQDYIRENFTRKDYAVLAAIHAPGQGGDERNIHAHLLVTLRTLDENGFSKSKAQEQDNFRSKGQYTEALRESWAKLGARHLERAGQTLEAERWRHGHKTLAEQREAALERGDLEFAERCDREPGKHLGPFAAALESVGVQTERGDLNREIAERNRERAELRAALREAQAELSGELARQREEQRKAEELHQQEQAEARAKEEERRAKQEREKAEAAGHIREAWSGSEGDGLAFMVALGGDGLGIARSAKGGFLAVDDNGRFYSVPRDIGQAIHAAQAENPALEIPGIEDFRRDTAQRKEAARQEREALYQQQRRERAFQSSVDLTPEQAIIRRCYAAAMSGQSFAEALEDNGYILARASREDAETAAILAGLAAHVKDAPEWKKRSTLKEGDYLVIGDHGHAHRLSERTTGAEARDIAGKMVNLAGVPLPTVQEGQEIMRDVREQRATERTEREREYQRQTQHRVNQQAARAQAHPSDPWRRVRQDATPRPLHPDDHARRQREEAERQPDEAAKQQARLNPEASNSNEKAKGERVKTAQEERREKLLRMARESQEQQQRERERGGGRTRGR